MGKIKIMAEFMHSPIWYCNDKGVETLKVDSFKRFINDKELNDIASHIQTLYESYLEFDSHNEACWFNKEKEIKDAEIMYGMIKKLKQRIDVLNNNEFEIVDLASKYYLDLIKKNSGN